MIEEDHQQWLLCSLERQEYEAWLDKQQPENLNLYLNQLETEMANVNDIYGASSTLKAEDLKGRAHKVVIESTDIVEFKENGAVKKKLVLRLRDKQKGLVLNKTNSKIIAKFYGEDFEKWGGKSIEIFPTQTEFNSQLVDCIRVRVEAPAAEGFSNDIPF